MDTSWLKNVIDCLVEYLYRWQTLLAGLIALAAALWTVMEIRRQIALQESQIKFEERRHADSLARRSLVGRAQLPDALSSLGDYASRCLKFISGDLAEAPSHPDEGIAAIKAAIEFVDRDAAEKLLELTKFYQIHNSRLSHFRAREHNITLTERQYDLVYLRWLADRLYGYARGSEDDGAHRTEREQVISALRGCVGVNEYFENEAKWARLLQYIVERHPDS